MSDQQGWGPASNQGGPPDDRTWLRPFDNNGTESGSTAETMRRPQGMPQYPAAPPDPRGSYPQPQQPNYPQGSFQQPNYPQGNFQQPNYPQGNYQQPNYPQPQQPYGQPPGMQPGPPRRSSAVPVVIGVGIGLLVLGVVASLYLAGGLLAVPKITPVPSVTVVVTSTAAPATTSARTTAPTSAPATTSVVSPEQAALVDMTALANTGISQAAPHGQWFAQLSSKYVGITDPRQVAANGSHTFYAADILAEYRSLSAQVSGVSVVLLRSADYGKRRTINGQTLWVTAALGGFGSKGEAQAWCATQYPALSGDALANVCMPNQLNP